MREVGDSLTVSYEMPGSGVMAWGNEGFVVFSEYPQASIIRYSYVEERLLSDTLMKLDAPSELIRVGEKAYLRWGDSIAWYNDASLGMLKQALPASAKPIHFSKEKQAYLLPSAEGYIYRESSENGVKSIPTNSSNVDSIIYSNGKAYLINWTSTDTRLLSFDSSGLRIQSYEGNISHLIFDDDYFLIQGDSIIANTGSMSIESPYYDLISTAQIELEASSVYLFVYRNGIVAYEGVDKILENPIDLTFLDTHTIVTQISDGRLILSDGNQSLILSLESNPFYLWNRVYDRWFSILIIILVLFAAYYYYRRYQRAQREIKELTEDLGGGLFISIDQNGLIKRFNKNAALQLGLEGAKGTQFSDVLVREELQSLRELLEKAQEEKRDFTQKTDVIVGNKHFEYMFQVNVLHGTLGGYRGAVLFGTDITEELERKRLRNWAQLAHDMQTNLSVIKLNTDQLRLKASGTELERLEKIKHQTDVLLQRVRDIVTIGRGGNNLFTETSIRDIFAELKAETDTMEYDDIKVEYHSQDFKAVIERKKLTRALRNAIENGVKAIDQSAKNKGLIEVTAKKDLRFCYISIKDNGKGMEKAVLDRMLTPYFTTGAASGGSGIGTMIMSNVVEIHGGRLEIKSEPGKGTEVIFILPLRHKSRESDNDA